MPDRQCVITLLSPKPHKMLRYCDLIVGTSCNWNSLEGGTLLVECSSTNRREHHRFSLLTTDQDVPNRLGSELSQRETGKRRDEIWRITSENTINEIRPGA
jgi:hypothetical protein